MNTEQRTRLAPAVGSPVELPPNDRDGERIRVLVADDDEEIRSALTALLLTDPEISLVGEASDAQAAIDLASHVVPDVALLDVRMPRGGGYRAASEITRRCPGTRVIGVSAHEDAESILAMLEAGATAYIAKGDDSAEIITTIHRSVREDPQARSKIDRDIVKDIVDDTRWAARRRERRDRIAQVVEEGGPRIVFQPIVDLASGRLAGAEALARFDGSSGRAPDTCFADADEFGLLLELELTTMRNALWELDQLPSDAFLSVNLSPSTCCAPELIPLIDCVGSHRIVLELTEHAPVEDYDRLSRCLAPIRARGVKLAVDDTGAGFSSLSHVLALAPELIKLDIAMSRKLEADDARQALVSSLVGFASATGADIVAEGIESAAQLEALRELGVRYGQGFHVGRPQRLPLDDAAFRRRTAS